MKNKALLLLWLPLFFYTSLSVSGSIFDVQNYIKSGSFLEALQEIESQDTVSQNGFLLEIEHSLVNSGNPTILRFQPTNSVTNRNVTIDGVFYSSQNQIYRTPPNNLGEYFQMYVDPNGKWKLIQGSTSLCRLTSNPVDKRAFSYEGFTQAATGTPSDFPELNDWQSLQGQLIDFEISNLFTDEALIYKFIADIGYYYENTIPDYLVENWNFVSGKTQTAYNYDPTISRESPKSIELVDAEETFGTWEYYDDQPFPLVESGMSARSQYRLFSIYNWDVRKEITPKFSHNDSGNGYYHAKTDGASISFKYNPSNNVSKQVNFSIQEGYSGMLKVYVNGTNIGGVYSNGYIYLELENIESWNIVGFLPLVLVPGDIVTFEAHEYYWDDTSGDFTIGPSIKPSIDSLADFESPENGVGYTITYPNYGDSKTIGDIFATATQEDLPSRKLLRSLINTLSLISAEANVVLPMSFTEANYDIIIQYEDAMMLKSILELYDSFLSITGQYNLDIPYDYDTLVDFGPYKTFKAFFSDFPNALEGLPDRLSDQADTKANTLSALTKLEEILPVMFDRGSLDSDSNDISTDMLYSSYLFTISDNSENEDLTDLLAQISALKTSLNGFINPSALTLSSDKGYNISLEPFVMENPFPIKNFIKDIEKDPLLSWKFYNDDSVEGSKEDERFFELMKKYGLVKDYLPMSLEENILVFKDENGEIIKTIMNNDDDDGGIYYSGTSGKLYAEIFDFQESGNNDFFKLKKESDGTISWSYHKPDYTQSEFQYVNYRYSDWWSQKYEAEYRGGRLAVLDTLEKINRASSLIPDVSFSGENSEPIVSIGARRDYDEYNYGIYWLDGSRLEESAYSWTENNPESEPYIAMTTGGLLLDVSYWDLYNENNMGFIMEIPNTNTPGYSGEFLYYKASLDLNNNGKSDGVDIDNIGYEEHGLSKTTSLNYTSPLNSSLVQNAEDDRIQAAPNKIMGMIFIHKESNDDDHDHYEEHHSDYYSNLLWPYEVTYYISEHDSIELDAEDYESGSGNYYREWSEYNYSNGIIHKDIWEYDDDPTVLHYLTSYSGYYYNDGEEEKFVCYPGYLDMDNDGVSDASEIMAGIIPYFIDYPSYTEIQYAIDAYADNDNNSEGIGNNINVNTNALEDSDNDNMPDALELEFGGNPSNSNDAQTSLDAIMSTESYSLNEIIDLRLGSTLYQVSEGLASFNIILEQSTDLTTWTPYGEYSMELSDDGDSDIKFFRFKMAD